MCSQIVGKKIISMCGAVFIAAVLSVVLPVPGAVAAATPTAAASRGAAYLAGAYQAGAIPPAFDMGDADWAAIALTAEGATNPTTVANPDGVSLAAYVANEKTDAYGRKLLALQALGLPTVQAAADLAVTFDGTQFGSPTLLNDDYFAIMAAAATGESALRQPAQTALKYVLAHQAANGGFGYATSAEADGNMTSAALVALGAAKDAGVQTAGLDEAIGRAAAYLLTTQTPSGGFEYDAVSGYGPDADSTAWALMALQLFGDTFSAEAAAARTWLLTTQNPGGGFRPSWSEASSTYTTANVIPALLGTTWLLNKTPQLEIVVPNAPSDDNHSSSAPSISDNQITSAPVRGSVSSGAEVKPFTADPARKPASAVGGTTGKVAEAVNYEPTSAAMAQSPPAAVSAPAVKAAATNRVAAAGNTQAPSVVPAKLSVRRILGVILIAAAAILAAAWVVRRLGSRSI